MTCQMTCMAQRTYTVSMALAKALTVVVLVLLHPAVQSAAAQELSLLAGTMQDTDTGKPSYAWQLEYRRWMTDRFAVSVSYLNEGHVPSHHRDGGAVQVWTRMQVLDPRLSVGGSVGPYYYFDSTQPPSGMGYANEHGWGVIGSLALTWFDDDRLIYQLRANLVETPGMDTNSILIGVGYQLDVPPWLREPIPSERRHGVLRKNEVTVLAGRTIVNSFESEHALAVSIEYRRRLARFLEGTASVLDEGKNDRIDRSGVAVQFWLVHSIKDDLFSIGLGGGGYYARDRARQGEEGGDDYVLSGIASLSGSVLVTEGWKVRATWSRVRTHYHRDTDVIQAGLGYLF